MIVFISLVYFTLLIIGYLIDKKSFVSPNFLFFAGLFFSSVWAVMYKQKWDVVLLPETAQVLLWGGIVFFIISTIIGHVTIRGKKNDYIVNEIQPIVICKGNILVFIFVLFFTLFLTIYYMRNLVGGDVLSLFARFRDQHSQNELPIFVRIMSLCIMAAGFWFSYVNANNIVYYKKINSLEFFAWLGCILFSFTTGGRNTAFEMILSFGVIYIVVHFKMGNANRFKIPFKIMIKITVIFLLFLLSFKVLSDLLGRAIDINFMDYLAMYCGAPIKNLDLLLHENIEKNNVWGSNTFSALIGFFNRRIGIPNYNLGTKYFTFRWCNGYWLGNVYTTFSTWYVDFGFWGVVILSAMSMISSLLYKKSINSNFCKYPNISLQVYGYISSTLLLSFYADKFYSHVFTSSFVIYIMLWNIYNCFFCKLKIKFGHIQ